MQTQSTLHIGDARPYFVFALILATLGLLVAVIPSIAHGQQIGVTYLCSVETTRTVEWLGEPATVDEIEVGEVSNITNNAQTEIVEFDFQGRHYIQPWTTILQYQFDNQHRTGLIHLLRDAIFTDGFGP